MYTGLRLEHLHWLFSDFFFQKMHSVYFHLPTPCIILENIISSEISLATPSWKPFGISLGIRQGFFPEVIV